MNSSRGQQPADTFVAVRPNPAALVPRAFVDARFAQRQWAITPLADRLARARELRRLIADNALPLAEASASARSRPAAESLTAEVLPLAEACRFLEREAEKILSPRRLGRRGLPVWLTGVSAEIRREPFGVVLIIGPGNYPLLLPGVQILQALVAGNAVLLKPGVGGTAAAELFRRLVVRAGFDPQIFALLPESTEAAEAAISASPDKVIFTGSAATGRKILAQLAPHLTPATMELSGCDAVIVRGDADLDLVTRSLRFGLTLNNGATCMAPRRVFVARAVATELEGRLARAFSSEAADAGTPLMGARSCGTRAGMSGGDSSTEEKHLPMLIQQAVDHGAHFITGGLRTNGGVRLPVVLAGVRPDTRLLQEDVFAPVMALVTVADDQEALWLANDCAFALGASIFSRDEKAANELARHIDAGVVCVNDLIVPTADARVPFGGRKRSGFGVTRGPEGLLELTTPKLLTVSRGRFRPALEPACVSDTAFFQAYLNLTHGNGLISRCRAALALIRNLTQQIKATRNRTVRS